jgi:nucleotide-binding universal stress UspA family protein
MKVILLPVSDRPESQVATNIAVELGQRLDANITGCHLRPHRELSKDYKPSGLPLFGSANREWLEQLDSKSTKSSAHVAHKMFTDTVEQGGYELVRKPALNASRIAIWQELVGSPDRLMSIIGPLADLVVVSRPKANGDVARMFMLAALLNSGRPVLVLPQAQTSAPGKNIAIAWNQSPEAARTVIACVPLLQTAENVTIIACGSEGRLGPKSSQLKDYLRNYGVNAKAVVKRKCHEEEGLMDIYRETRSDLLIMGAYSRSRLREVVFGGVTEFMLTKAKIPVIMQHT